MSRKPALHAQAIRVASGVLVAALGAGCLIENEGGSGGLGATTASPPSPASTISGTAGVGSTGSSGDGGSSGTTGGFCFPDGVFVGLGSASVCCSDKLDAMGYCGTDGGLPQLPCPPGCNERAGFHCEAGNCILNGDLGPMQFTLSWEHTPRTPEDFDLHVVEPGGCEIYWGNRQCVGKLDLDANAGCENTDPDGGFGSDIENVIYSPGTLPPSGTYTVRVDDWQDCTGAPEVNFTVKARIGDGGIVVHDHFVAADADNGGPGSGRTEIVFTYP